MREYTYGPFPSRRLGLSLGVDVLLRDKICTFNCVYCEIGSTQPNNLVSPLFRIKKRPTLNFRKELKEILKFFPHLNSITFGYNGEPTLNEYIAEYQEIAADVREEFNWTTAPPNLTLFTNSTTLFLKEIRERIKNFDVILAKLDSANQSDLQSTNQPHENVSSIEGIIESLALLSRELTSGHQLTLQCLFYNSYRTDIRSNYNDENVQALIAAIKKINPSNVQIYTIARIPAEPHVYSLGQEELKELTETMRNAVNNDKIRIEYF